MPQYNGVWTLEAAAQAQSNQQWVTDPNFRNTTLLLQADNAANSAQNNTFLDSSSNSFAITRNGNTTQGTFTPFSQSAGRWSTYYTGVADNNATYLATNAAYSFGTGDFTVEAWVNIPPIANTNGKVIVDSRPDSTNGAYWIFSLTNNGRLNATTMATGGVTISSTNPIPTNQWVHVAYTRRSGTLNLWVNGLSVATASGNTDNISSSTLWIGRLAFSSAATDSWFAGYMSNLRIVKGVAVYTGNFTPQTTPLTATQPSGVNIAAITGSQTSLLMQQSNRFVDNSSIAAPILTLNTWPSIQTFSPFAPQFQWTAPVIGGSGYFDGTGDQLTAPNNTVFAFGSGNFTVETWAYATGTTGSWVNYSNGVSTNANWAWDLYQNSATSIQISLFQGTTQYIASSTSFSINAWNHIAAVRNGNTMTIYVNGVAGGTTANVTGVTANDPGGSLIRVSGYSNATNMITGYLSGLRIVKGTAVYTTPFTPPTAPLTAVTNTSLLLNFTNAGIYDAAMDNVLETVGNAQVSTSVVKYGSGSMYFDGSGDVLNVQSPVLQTSNLGSGNLTVEGWLYPLTLGSSNCFVGSYTAASAGHWLLYSSSGTNLALFGSGVPSLSVTLTLNTWQHFAWVKHNGVSTLYLNGVAISSAADTNNYTGANFLTVGAYNGTTGPWNGYMDDLRITKGVARYTTNFIPPQVALPRQ
jgi:hypothetical protein